MFEGKVFDYITLLLLCLLCHSFVTAQEYVLVGVLTVDGAGNYTYKLQFSDSAGVIKGYSVTDIGGPHQTKSAITGNINSNRKELVFKETHIIKTKSPVAKEDFCFVQARLKLAGLKKGKALNGSFIGYGPRSKVQCAKGTITLYSATDMLDKLMRLSPAADSALRPMRAKLQERDTPYASVISINSENGFETHYDSPSATLELWDDKHIDGDIVSVRHNDKTVLANHSLTAGRKQLQIQLTGKTDTIALIAISEGTEPSNTAMLKLTTGASIHYLKASSKLNTPTYIILRPKGSN